ncbi:DNA-binding protein [Mycobacterium intracellulare]|uniref:DNA-binding protein n=1 Tax=Mycobacterium intracellulare TaxID=1767 RepID=UPI000CE4E3BF|nr:DNA-binding protein [Mycobacterium intracellulare]
MKTYSLAEVAATHLPREWKDPVRWLSARLNRGELHGIRFGRYWRMSEADVDYMLSKYSNGSGVPDKTDVVVAEHTSIVDGISQRSQRRVRRAS